jgi:transcriptional regulator with XRE-family HTH domain
MKDQNLYIKIRTKKLGLLLYDARLATGKSILDCTKITGIPMERITDFEAGIISPTLPELEILSFFYKIPLEHFWGNDILSENDQEHQAKKFKQLMTIRHRVIGANIKSILDDKNILPEDFASSLRLDPDIFQKYLSGEEEIPIPILEMIARNLDCRIEDFFDTQGIIGNWRSEMIESQRLKEIPDDLREFISKPINVPYIELAIRLSELDVNKLRAVAEGLLEITL